MDETGMPSSRRTLLRWCVAGSFAGVAGCLGGGDDTAEDDQPPDDERTDNEPTDEELPDLFELAGDGTVPFAEWLAPEAPHGDGNGRETLFVYQDFAEGIEQGWQAIEIHRQNLADSTGTDPDSHEGELLIGVSGSEGGMGEIYVGEFDSNSVVEHLESQGGSVTGEYEGYTVVGDELAVGDDAIILTPEYEHFIDARHGGGPHLRDEVPAVSLILDLQPAGPQLSASRREDDSSIAATATTFTDIDDGGSPQRAIRTFVFESAEAASVERAEESLGEDATQRILTDEKHGRVVMVEYET